MGQLGAGAEGAAATAGVMLLVDTSVWVDHLRRGDAEMACGTMARREEILGLLATLPRVPEAEHAELWTRDGELAQAAVRLGVGHGGG